MKIQIQPIFKDRRTKRLYTSPVLRFQIEEDLWHFLTAHEKQEFCIRALMNTTDFDYIEETA